MKIAVIDYNMGNLASVVNAFAHFDTKIDVISKADELVKYDKIVLPGVGAFKDAMEHLKSSNLDLALKDYITTGRPIFGICLGMQLLFESSTEFGHTDGLGLIEGRVIKFEQNKFEQALKIPHMGWNKMFLHKYSPLFRGLDDSVYLYFIHSYHAVCDEKYIIGKTRYGYEFVSAVQKENIYGFQPHPEKSHENGLKIIENFIKL